MEEYGLQRVKEEQIALGEGVRSLLESRCDQGRPPATWAHSSMPAVLVVMRTVMADVLLMLSCSGRGFPSVAAEGFKVSQITNPDPTILRIRRFAQ